MVYWRIPKSVSPLVSELLFWLLVFVHSANSNLKTVCDLKVKLSGHIFIKEQSTFLKTSQKLQALRKSQPNFLATSVDIIFFPS